LISLQYPKWLGIVHQASLGPKYQESKYKGGKALFGGTFSIKMHKHYFNHQLTTALKIARHAPVWLLSKELKPAPVRSPGRMVEAT